MSAGEWGIKVMNSKRIAGLLGPTTIAITLSEATNLHIWTNNIAPSVNLAPVVYLNGTLLFVAGLSIIRAHNYWGRDWPVLVTLMGWLVMLGGLIRMFAPVSGQHFRLNTAAMYTLIIVLLAVGIFLTFKAYSLADGNTVADAVGTRQ